VRLFPNAGMPDDTNNGLTTSDIAQGIGAGALAAGQFAWRPGLVCPAQRCAVLFTYPAAKAALRERQRAKLPP